MNSMQYSDNLCQAIEIIANNVVQGLNYDKTILCTITNIDKAKQGQYTVSDGSSTYIAYSSIKTYKLNTQVYVLIPNGDYNQQKMIVGDYSTFSSEDKGYSLPIDTIIPVEKLEYENSDTTFGLIANENKEKGTAISVLSQTELELGPQYTRLAIEGDFQTNFNQSVIDGNYGIVVLLSGKDKNDNNITDRVYSFNCNDFFGNPYNFTAAVTQSVVFNISDFKKIEVIKVQVQESGDFYDVEKKYLPVDETANIIIKNLTFTFGFDINEYDNNDLLISSKNELTYDNEGQKDLLLNWIRQRNNKTLFSINNEDDITSDNYNYLRYLWRTPDKNENSKYYVGKTTGYISIYWYNYVLNNIPTDLVLKEDLWQVSKHFNNQFYQDYFKEEVIAILQNKAIKNEIIQEIIETKNITKLDVEIQFSPSENEIINKWMSFENDKISTPFNFSFNPSIENFREKVKVAIAISGCLAKKTLKTQEIEIDNEIKEVVVVQEKTQYGQTKYEPDYEYIYYSPKDELKVEDIFAEVDDTDVPAYYINDTGKYEPVTVTAGEEEKQVSYQRVTVEWVQYYQKENLSVDDKGKVELENGNSNKPIYSTPEYIYLTTDEFQQLDNQSYKNYKTYKLTLTPLVLLKSNEVVFENTDKGSYKRLNLINNIKLECLDELKGRYFIYGLDNTISLNMANNGGRKIQVSFNSINSEDVKSDNIKIQWKIPVNNTMISEPTEEELSADIYDEDFLIWNLDDEKNPSYWVSNEITIKNTASGSKDTTDFLAMSIPYGIKDYYSPSLTNNTIICLIKKVVNGAKASDITVNQTEFELLFGPSGTNGTDYTLKMSLGKVYNSNYEEISSEKQSFIKRNSPNDYIKIDWNLYDGKNLVQNATGLKCSWWVTPEWANGKSTVQLEFEENSNKYFIHSCYNSSNNNFNLTKHCAILKGTLTYNGIELEAYLPIPMRYDTSENKIAGYEGVDKIIYDGNGTNPIYYKNEHKFYDSSQKEITYNSALKWYIYVNREKRTSREDKNYFPTFMDGESNTNKLKPSNIYYSNNEKAISIIASKSSISDETPAEDIIFAQPVLIIQNRFGNSMLNKWNGNLLIDEDNNSILAAQIAAGSKDNNNKFSGVLMGAVGQDGTSAKHGLYGYHKGALSFGFKEDGTAFIGKSGRGRIEFNGTSGTITSSNWTTNNLGMHLNLDTGVAQFKNTGGSVVINPTQSAGLFRISTMSGSILMNVGENNYYLQSAGYQSNNKGFRLDLASNGFTLKQLLSAEAAESEAGILLSSSNDTHFRIFKNVKRMAKSINCTINCKINGNTSAINGKYDFYVHEKGTRLIVRKTSSNVQSFYLSQDLNLNNSKLFRERVEIADSSRTDSWKYRLLWELISEYNQLSALNFISTSTGRAWSYNSSNDYYEYTNPDTGATSRFYAAEYSSGSVNTNTKWCNAGPANELNCLTYHCHSNTLFGAIGTDVHKNEQGKNVANPLKLGGYRCVFNKNKNVTSWQRELINLKDSSNNDINVNSWEIAIPYVKTSSSANQPLYVLAGKIYKFSIPTNYTLGNTLTADPNPLQTEAFYNSGYNKIVNGKYFVYQGMAVDDKYFYFPAMRVGDYSCQIIDVRDRTTGKRINVSGGHVETDSDGNNWEFMKIDNVLPGYEVEDISLNESFMILSFLNVSDGQYLSKIYRIPYSSANGLPGKIDLKDATAIFEIPQYPQQRNIYNGTSQNTATISKSKDFFTTRKTSQGFTFYYDSVIGDYVFVTAYVFKNTTENDKDQILVLNTFKEMKTISSRKTINLINIGTSSFYLQSANYDNTSQTGTYFNLETGSLITNTGTIGGWNIKPGYIDSSATVEGKISRMYIASNTNSSANYIAAIYDNNYLFRVDRKGKLFATGADITGKITAKEGQIGNCTIDASGKLNVPAANITGTLSVGHIDTGSITIGANQVTSGTFVPARIPNLSVDKLTAGHLSGFTLQTGTSSSYVYLSSTGAEFRWGSKVYGTITTTVTKPANSYTDQEKYWTLLGKKSNINAISFGFDENGTPAYFLFKDDTLDYQLKENSSGPYFSYSGHAPHTFSAGTLHITTGDLAVSKGDLGIGGSILCIGGGLFAGPVYTPNTLSVATNAVTFDSDVRIKKNINDLSNTKYEIFFNALKPVSYQFIKGTSDRIHLGFISQEVEEGLIKSGLDSYDFAGFVVDESDEEGLDGYKYQLRYSEFIALNTHMIQKCLKRIDELENEVKTLKAQL